MINTYLLRYVILITSTCLSADVISPTVQAAQDRLRNNPNVYDRVDNFCQGKKPQDRCTVSGPIISGGGEGVCINTQTNSYSDSIDLACIRTKYVDIDRDIAEGENKSDRFCKAKKLGSPCNIEFVYDDKMHTAAGTCKIQIETKRYYYQGYHNESRSTIQCQAEPLPERTYIPVSIIKKLFQ